MFSKACEYAIRAVIYLASVSGNGLRHTVKEISKEISVPEAYTAKLFQLLSHQGIIASIKGPGGGFFLPEENNDIRLINIVKAIDGDTLFNACALGLEKCDKDFPCPLHHKFVDIRDELTRLLRETTIQQLTHDLKKGNTFLERKISF